jgi:hypothetical protein
MESKAGGFALTIVISYEKGSARVEGNAGTGGEQAPSFRVFAGTD